MENEHPIPCHVEYVWLDHNQNFRSKTKVLTNHNPKRDGLPMWNYDGSSTKQANGANSEVFIRPIKLCYDPFRSCLLYTSPSPRDGLLSRMPSSA